MSAGDVPVIDLCDDLENQYIDVLRSERQDSEASEISQASSTLAGTRRRPKGVRPSESEGSDRTKKKIHPKVRTGCDTCKRRKIKCDEGKPFCQRCIKSGRQCEGYHPPQPRMFEPLLKRQRSNVSSKEDSQQYYLNDCSWWLSRYKPTQLDHKFWNERVPHLAEELAPVQQCLIAASATCEKYEARYNRQEPNEEIRERTVFALEQYTIALQDLRSCISNSSISNDATLICCLLLTFSDAYHIGVPLTFDHVFAGLQLCKLIKKSSPAKSPLATKSEIDGMMLLPAFAYWADCAQIYCADMTEQRMSLVREFAELPSIVTPPYFDDADEAYASMDKVLRQIAKITIDTSDDTIFELYQSLANLLKAYQASLGLTKHVEDTSANFAFRSLIVHHRTAIIMLNTLNNVDETIFDSYTADFEFVVAETESLMRLQTAEKKLEIQKDRIWLGVVPPLFFAASKCRGREIRQRAIDAMHNAPHNERLWSTCTAAQVARELLWLEEDVQLIGEQSQTRVSTVRVNLKEIKFDLAASKIQLSYERQNVKGPRFATSTISWEKDHEVDAFHPPNTFDMPQAMVKMAGYSPLLTGYRGIACHCKGRLNASEHNVLLRSTLE